MNARLAGMHAAQGATVAAPPSPRLLRAAQEFEGQMMKELLKPLTESDGLTGTSEADGSGSALGEFAAESLAAGISQRGGFGIAGKVLGELSRFSTAPNRGMEARGLHFVSWTEALANQRP